MRTQIQRFRLNLRLHNNSHLVDLTIADPRDQKHTADPRDQKHTADPLEQKHCGFAQALAKPA
jgi:hypothetical protein